MDIGEGCLYFYSNDRYTNQTVCTDTRIRLYLFFQEYFLFIITDKARVKGIYLLERLHNLGAWSTLNL